jgi:hypothetical protein
MTGQASSVGQPVSIVGPGSKPTPPQAQPPSFRIPEPEWELEAKERREREERERSIESEPQKYPALRNVTMLG